MPFFGWDPSASDYDRQRYKDMNAAWDRDMRARQGVWVVDARTGGRVQHFGNTSRAIDWINSQRHPEAYQIE